MMVGCTGIRIYLYMDLQSTCMYCTSRFFGSRFGLRKPSASPQHQARPCPTRHAMVAMLVQVCFATIELDDAFSKKFLVPFFTIQTSIPTVFQRENQRVPSHDWNFSIRSNGGTLVPCLWPYFVGIFPEI